MKFPLTVDIYETGKGRIHRMSLREVPVPFIIWSLPKGHRPVQVQHAVCYNAEGDAIFRWVGINKVFSGGEALYLPTALLISEH